MKKKYGEKHSFIELTFVVGAHWNCLNEAYVTQLIVFPIKRNSRGEHPAALKLPPAALKLPPPALIFILI